MHDAKPEQFESKAALDKEQAARETARKAFNDGLARGMHLRAARRLGDKAYRKAGGRG